MREKIKYHEIMELGFNEEPQSDSNYFEEFGFEYVITTLQLTKKIYIDWVKETQLCELIRIDSPKKMNIIKRMDIINLEHLKTIIEFYSDVKTECSPPLYA